MHLCKAEALTCSRRLLGPFGHLLTSPKPTNLRERRTAIHGAQGLGRWAGAEEYCGAELRLGQQLPGMSPSTQVNLLNLGLWPNSGVP